MQPADDKLRKRKKYLGEKKIDTFRSPTRELVLNACFFFANKTRKAAGQLEQEHIFLLKSRALHQKGKFGKACRFFQSVCAKQFFHY